MPTVRKYSSRSQQTTLTSGITSSATSASVVSGTGILGGVTISAGELFTVVIDPDTALEEIVDVSAASGNTLTIIRGVDGSTAQAHSAGAVIRHMAIGRDYRESNEHINLSTNVHGISGNVVGTTDSQTLTNKTITAPTITGLSNPTNGGDAANKTYVDAILGSATSAATSATAAAASASAASTSASGAATSASNAATSATSASSSASSASTSASTATTKASEAATSATNAASSASSASTSASTATTKASEASTSASNAATSATSASNSATSAASSATAASGSATSASNSYTAIVDQTGKGLVRDMGSIADADTTTDTYIGINAQVSAATTQATNAANSATAAASSASSAATSASNANTYAGNASTSATSAAAYDVSAQNWATKTDGAVAGGEYSAKYHAQAASSSATAAAASATTAAGYIPSMTGNSGKFLTTNGTAASWVDLSDWGTI